MGLLTPNIYEYKTQNYLQDTNKYDTQDLEEDNYFSNRAALSVPSSRIDTFSAHTNPFDQEINQFMNKSDNNTQFTNQLPFQNPDISLQQQNQQFYYEETTFAAPQARPMVQRQSTAPVLSLSAKNLEQQQQLQHQRDIINSGQLNPNTNTTSSTTNTHFHHQRVGRPKKKPGFHLKLDGLRKVSPTITSSQSDSGTDYWNRTPSGGYSRSKLSFTPAFANQAEAEEDAEAYNLKLLERDFEIVDPNLTIPSFNLTPSVEPPSSRNGYFDAHHNLLNNGPATTGGFFSPAINDNSVNHFNKTFEEYLQDANKTSTDYRPPQNTLDTNFTELDIPQDNNQLFAPLQLEQTISNEFLSAEDENILPNDHGYSNDMNSQYLGSTTTSNRVVSGEPPHQQQQYQSDGRYNPPVLQRTVSNQSGHSIVSLGSESTRSTSTNVNVTANSPIMVNTSTSSITSGKPSKKRVSKGAVCTVCDKFISRDIARHMRIHDDVGRFQCVYPKEMCTHRTQNFNRPYDYKKHLLHSHFLFDDPKGKTANTLTDKLPIQGSCSACGVRFVAGDWLDSHVLTKDKDKRCPYINQ
ncbi:hypothetical protein SBY92_003483 [Candida maltosa Xu316]